MRAGCQPLERRRSLPATAPRESPSPWPTQHLIVEAGGPPPAPLLARQSGGPAVTRAPGPSVAPVPYGRMRSPVQCPACGHLSREGARFCANCGEPLSQAIACPRCGASTCATRTSAIAAARQVTAHRSVEVQTACNEFEDALREQASAAADKARGNLTAAITEVGNARRAAAVEPCAHATLRSPVSWQKAPSRCTTRRIGESTGSIRRSPRPARDQAPPSRASDRHRTRAAGRPRDPAKGGAPGAGTAPCRRLRERRP
jgi:hypothetical protein